MNISLQTLETSKILEETLRIQSHLQDPNPNKFQQNTRLSDSDRTLALSLALICLFRRYRKPDLESRCFPIIEAHNALTEPSNSVLQPSFSFALYALHEHIEKPSSNVYVQSEALKNGMLTGWTDAKIILALKQQKQPVPDKKLEEANRMARLLHSLDIEHSVNPTAEPTVCVRNPHHSRNGYIQIRNSNTPGASRKIQHPADEDTQNLFIPAFFACNLQERTSATLFLREPHARNIGLPASIHGENTADLGTRILAQIKSHPGQRTSSSAKSKYIQHQDQLWNETVTLSCKNIPHIKKDPKAKKAETKEETGKKAEELQKAEVDSVYQNWKPTLAIKCKQIPDWKPVEHPAILSVPTALFELVPPKPQNTQIPKWILQNNVLSDSQVEAYLRAQDALNSKISGGQICRNGFLLGDGTGTGKGRIIATLAADAWSRGHRRSLWISISPRLANDALRDWQAVGGTSKTFHALQGDSRQGIHVSDGLMFCSYASLRTNHDNLLEWLQQADSPEQDPFVAFDESQSLGNITSSQGASAMYLQSNLPDARILYTSSTPFRSIESLCYATRLGLWDRKESPFSSPEDMIESLEQAGIAGLEILQRELCQSGRAMTRSLSVADIVTYPVEIKCSPQTKKSHDVWAYAWQLAANKREDAMIETNAQAGGAVPRNSFNATRLAFFTHLICAAKGDGLIKALEEDIDNDLAPVIQLSSTMEAYASRRIAEWKEEEGADSRGILEIPEDFDLSPKRDICNAVKDCFPIHLMKPDTDPKDRRKTIAVPVLDKNGNKIISAKAVVARNAAIEALSKHPVGASLLDRLCEHFGDRIAEVTGRSQRVERHNGKRVMVSRTPENSRAEVEEFLNGRRQLLVFTGAGAHGRSYHSDRSFRNQKQRIHYVAQIPWAIDDTVQGLGRTHRTNQVSPPVLKMVTTDIPGEMRFSSTACRKLNELGALTRGDRRGQSNESMSLSEHANLDTIHGRQAVRELIRKSTQKTPWKGFDIKRTRKLFSQYPPENMGINVFLNAMMTFPFDEQHDLMNNYQHLHKIIYDDMKAKDLLDNGVEILKCRRADTITTIPLARVKSGREPDTVLRLIEFASTQNFGYPQHDFLRLHSNIVEGVSGNTRLYRGYPSAFSRAWSDPYSSSAVLLEIRDLPPNRNLLLLYPGGARMHNGSRIGKDGNIDDQLYQELAADHPILASAGGHWKCHNYGSSPSTTMHGVIRHLQGSWNISDSTFPKVWSFTGKQQTQVLGIISGKILPVWKLVRTTVEQAHNQSLTMRIRKILVDSWNSHQRQWETGFVLPLGDALDLWQMMKNENLL